MELDVQDEDLEVIKNPMATSNDLQEHLAFMISQKRRNVEVSLRNCNADEQRQFEEVKRGVNVVNMNSEMQCSNGAGSQSAQSVCVNSTLCRV